MNNTTILEIKILIDQIQEYVDTEICRKCEEMSNKLIGLKSMIEQYDSCDNKNQS